MYLLRDIEDTTFENKNAFLSDVTAEEGVCIEYNFKFAMQFKEMGKAKTFAEAINKCFDVNFEVVEVTFKPINLNKNEPQQKQ